MTALGLLLLYTRISIYLQNRYTSLQECSIAERARNVSVIHLGDALTYDYPLNDNYAHWTFAIRNFSLVYRINTEGMPETTFKNKLNDLNIIKQVALDLNDGKEALLYGKSENWEAQAFVQYYQNWYEDKDGGIRADQLSEQNVKVRYCGPEDDKTQSIQYEYKYSSGTVRGTFWTISEDKDGWVSLSKIESSSFIPDSKTVCILNLVWGNNNETITMTPKIN